MRSYPFRTPYLIRKLFRGVTCKVNHSKQKILYLTFDDGPHPEVTPYVLDLLDHFDAKATFFLVGENAIRYPEIVKDTLRMGHTIGNHTFRHLSGWKTSKRAYLKDVAACEDVIRTHLSEFRKTRLFRPPFGRILPSQVRALKGEYDIIMWSLLSGDFDQNLNVSLAKSALDQAHNGDIIVFHDSLKSQSNLKILLPWFLERFHAKGYKFVAL